MKAWFTITSSKPQNSPSNGHTKFPRKGKNGFVCTECYGKCILGFAWNYLVRLVRKGKNNKWEPICCNNRAIKSKRSGLILQRRKCFSIGQVCDCNCRKSWIAIWIRASLLEIAITNFNTKFCTKFNKIPDVIAAP